MIKHRAAHAKSSFSDVTKLRNVASMESNELNLNLQIKGIVQQGMGNLFNPSRSSHFLNKSDSEHYLFKVFNGYIDYAIFSASGPTNERSKYTDL